MNNQYRDSEAERDEALSNEYQRVASESTPQRLDGAILREARSAVRRRPTSVWSPFVRPLTIIASVAIALAIVLQFSELELSLQGEQMNGASDRLPVQAGGIADPGRDVASQRFCNPEQVANRESWLSCIDELRKTGRTDDARGEQALFDEHYRN